VELYLDPFMGIAGDMTVAALTDAGASSKDINHALAGLDVPGLCFTFERVMRQGLSSLLASASYPREHTHRHYDEIVEIIQGASLPEAVAERAIRAFTLLGEAEAHVHGCDLHDVHFHEVGAADALADIVGACAAWESLGRPEVICGPMNLGAGYAVAEHGRYPVPPPAVTEILKGLPVFSMGEAVERTTPTGAALAVSLASRFEGLPPGRISAVGYGAGKLDTADSPNVLRCLLIRVDAQRRAVSLLETYVDDQSPEALAFALKTLRQSGAKDVYLTPTQGKKSRSGWMISVLCDVGREKDFADVLFSHTSTIGVRHSRWERFELPRRSRTIATPYGELALKVALLPSGEERCQPEWDSLEALAREAGLSPAALLGKIKHLWP
jgi:pyridinium-3,5-bisthiocarboxylic acid mononucleotide nickel chelatase